MKGLGGDAGEYKAVTHVTLRDGVVYDGYVGAGGASAGAVSFRHGNPGEATRFFLFQAAGGQGGTTETPTSLLPSAGSLTGGGASLFAEGGISYQKGPAQGYGNGTDGAFGSGGGAGCAQTNDDTMTGGGGDGLVIVYGYRIAEDPA